MLQGFIVVGVLALLYVLSDIDFEQFDVIFLTFGSHFGVILGSWGVLGRQKGPHGRTTKNNQSNFGGHLDGIRAETLTPKSLDLVCYFFGVFLRS